jgi:farnesol dehydrogenase
VAAVGGLRILITGGTGFVGRAVVRRLAAAGHQPTLLVRPGSSRERFPASAAFAPGDVTDRASLERAAAGQDAIVHAAALVKILAPERDFDRINVGGLENVLAAAGGARVLYVSSFIALGPTEGGPGGVLDESADTSRDRAWINPYERTKTLADRRARAAIASGFPLDVVYPGVTYGPGELTEGNIVVRHILDLEAGKLPALLGRPERRWNYVFVEDVADGIARALESGPPGRRFVLGGENVTQAEFYRLIGELTGARIPSRRMPDAVAKLAGGAMRSWAQLTRGVPQLTPDLVEIYKHDWSLSSTKAEREIGYRPRSLRAGMTETVAWLKTLAR